MRTVNSRITEASTTAKTTTVAGPRFQPRLTCRDVTAGSIAMLKNRAMTSMLTMERAFSTDRTSTVMPSPIHTTCQIVCRMIAGTHAGGAADVASSGARGCDMASA